VRALDKVGFYATANDVRAGRIDRSEVAFRLRRDAPKRVAENAKACLSLAAALGDQ
jgi:hypothetical protein